MISACLFPPASPPPSSKREVEKSHVQEKSTVVLSRPILSPPPWAAAKNSTQITVGDTLLRYGCCSIKMQQNGIYNYILLKYSVLPGNLKKNTQNNI